MKKWTTPEVAELDINQTEYDLWGNSWDGGYVGDGILSGHLEYKDNGTGNTGNTGSTGSTTDITGSLS